MKERKVARELVSDVSFATSWKSDHGNHELVTLSAVVRIVGREKLLRLGIVEQV
eukprot:CAMPEP_0196747600 /NCGR_PEP_ID=MMETSP1091-20130531/70488_1 /TAXON_ID=302021 /ORGANISM="Rhodomonas sp., Strain CCMP768" /LENGTH=53 /DNA_ID=CAMNT_0042094785 /DNA_START=54 /DNA_END=211 /DNA_ORIENTATION=-